MKHFTDDTEWGAVYTGCHQDIPWPGCALTRPPALPSPSADPHWGSVAQHSLGQLPSAMLQQPAHSLPKTKGVIPRLPNLAMCAMSDSGTYCKQAVLFCKAETMQNLPQYLFPGSIWCYSFPMAEQTVWQPSNSKLGGYKVHWLGSHALRKEVWQGFSSHVCQVFQNRPPQWVLTSQANDGEWCQDLIKSSGKAEPLDIQVESVCKGTPDPEVIVTSFPLCPPIPVDKFIAGTRWVHTTDLLSYVEWHPEAVSWCWILLQMATAATLQFSRGFCFLLSCWGAVHNLHFSSQPWTSLGLTRVRLPGDGGEGRKQQQNTKLGQSTHKPDEGTVSSCIWFCSTSKSTILELTRLQRKLDEAITPAPGSPYWSPWLSYTCTTTWLSERCAQSRRCCWGPAPWARPPAAPRPRCAAWTRSPMWPRWCCAPWRRHCQTPQRSSLAQGPQWPPAPGHSTWKMFQTQRRTWSSESWCLTGSDGDLSSSPPWPLQEVYSVSRVSHALLYIPLPLQCSQG